MGNGPINGGAINTAPALPVTPGVVSTPGIVNAAASAPLPKGSVITPTFGGGLSTNGTAGDTSKNGTPPAFGGGLQTPPGSDPGAPGGNMWAPPVGDPSAGVKPGYTMPGGAPGPTPAPGPVSIDPVPPGGPKPIQSNPQIPGGAPGPTPGVPFDPGMNPPQQTLPGSTIRPAGTMPGGQPGVTPGVGYKTSPVYQWGGGLQTAPPQQQYLGPPLVRLPGQAMPAPQPGPAPMPHPVLQHQYPNAAGQVGQVMPRGIVNASR